MRYVHSCMLLFSGKNEPHFYMDPFHRLLFFQNLKHPPLIRYYPFYSRSKIADVIKTKCILMNVNIFLKYHISLGYRRSWLSTDSVSSLSVICHDVQGKIGEWFPVACYTQFRKVLIFTVQEVTIGCAVIILTLEIFTYVDKSYI